MKRLYIILTALLVTSFAFADFVEKSFEGQQVTIEEAVSHFNEWFGTGDSEFALFFDETDEIGLRDMDYQQYINGVKVENCALYVHSRNGYVTLINGDVMPISKMPEVSEHITPRRAIQIATKNDSLDVLHQKIIIHKQKTDGSFEYYQVFRIVTTSEEIFVDCSTGDVIQSLPLSYNATTCSINTKYNGLKSISCETNSDGKYILQNSTKNLRTLYANFNSSTSTIPENRYNFTNQSTTWSGAYLTTIVITAVHNSWWNPLVGDSNPDLYIRITDANGNLLYVSDYKEDCGLDTQFPIAFRLSSMVKIPANSGYKIEVWDEDLGDDTKGSTITLSNNEDGTYTWGSSSSNTEGYLIISPWHPALDVQWGLEKTWEFYNNTFNHQGFDGNNALTRAILHSPMSVSNIAAEISHSIFNSQAMEPNNAFACSPDDVSGAYLYFGMGNERCESLVDLNCVTHEFTHLVTAYRPKGKLVYQGESGAINEGYSDAMAVAAEALLKGDVNWKYGHGVSELGLTSSNKNIVYDYCRNLANPKNGGPEGPKPDTYGGQYWYDPTNTSLDYGGVHMNNSIFTHWFYILCEGKSGVNDNQRSYSVNPIGMEKALKIIWRMHRTYLPPQATYAQARQYAIQSAIDLFPGDEDVLKSVTDAWYAVGVGDKYVAAPDLITIKAMMPSNWGNTISAWTWTDGSNGSWASLTKEGSWYSYTSTVSPLNIVFVNGSNWSTDQNQTVDITLTESSCIQINSNGTGKRTYTIIDCEPQGDNYVVLARRSAGTNWFYMTSDLGTATTKRYQAVDAGTSSLANVNTSNLASKYYWQIEETKLHTAAGYSTWTSGNSAILDNTGKELSIVHQTNGTYTFSFADGTDTRYLALNATAGNNYFAYYKGTNQIYQLTLIKEGEHGTTMDIEEISCEEPISTKILHNGQIFILRGDKTYNLQGQEVKLE